MPKLTRVVPKYRKHRASGQAVATIAGRDFYLGPHGTRASRIEYDRVIAEWLAGGRQPLVMEGEEAALTVVEAMARYLQFAKQHYRKDGFPTSEADEIRRSLLPLCKLYGRTPASQFGPKALKAVRQTMVDSRLSRGVVNHRISRIKRAFKWAVAEELVPPVVFQGLAAVEGLRKGRTSAPDRPPVKPVEDVVVEETIVFLPAIVADMVRFQRLTGCRPSEVCILRPRDVDREGEVWKYVPESHKMEHRDRERIIVIGPKAQRILAPYLLRPEDAYCFSPAESEQKRSTERRANRQSPMTPSQAARRPKPSPKRFPGNRYTTNTYRRAIHRAIDLVNRRRREDKRADLLPKWSPNRLRHTAATEIRKRFGLEAAQVTLGHATADVSQIYAERDLQRAERVMREVG